MKDKLLKIFDLTFLKFLLVGVANTLFGSAVMFAFYNLLGFGYWISTASNYVFGSVLSYFLNRRFTFRSSERSLKSLLSFALNIIVCYAVAYGAAKPLALRLFEGLSLSAQENIAMLAGLCIFTLLNYLGQRFVVFRR